MKPKYKRLISILLAISSIIVGVTILLNNFNDNIVFFYTPSDLPLNKVNQTIRLGGIVENQTIKYNSNTEVEFVVTDQINSINVKYTGFLPSLFKEGQGVVAKGILSNEKIFIADEILIKHDENYMPKAVADKLKQQKLWKD